MGGWLAPRPADYWIESGEDLIGPFATEAAADHWAEKHLAETDEYDVHPRA